MKKSTLGIWLLLLALVWQSIFCSLVVASPVLSTNYKQIPIEQWEHLKRNQQSLVLKLNEAKLQAEMLLKQSDELNLKLAEAEKQLVISTQELKNSKQSLESAKALQEKTRTSLTELTAQIEAERKKQEAIQNRLRVQRTFAYILLGLAVVHK